jgi:hypothetical protein
MQPSTSFPIGCAPRRGSYMVQIDAPIPANKTLSKYVDDPEGQARKYLTVTIRNNKTIFGFDKVEVYWLRRSLLHSLKQVTHRRIRLSSRIGLAPQTQNVRIVPRPARTCPCARCPSRNNARFWELNSAKDGVTMLQAPGTLADGDSCGSQIRKAAENLSPSVVPVSPVQSRASGSSSSSCFPLWMLCVKTIGGGHGREK